jgi:hypothetical protein
LSGVMRGIKSAVSLIALILFGVISCTPGYEKDISKGIQLCQKGDLQKGMRSIERGLIEYTTIETFNISSINYNETVLYSRNEKLSILYPVEFDAHGTVQGGTYRIYYHAASDRMVIGHNVNIDIYSGDGTHITRIDLKSHDVKNIKSLIINGNDLILYHDGLLSSFSLDTLKRNNFVEGKFSPPFKGLSYNVIMRDTKNIIAIIVGIAGTYHLSIINSIDKSVMIRNMSISSSRLYLDEKYIYYIAGTSGSWFLERMSLSSEEKKKLHKFEDLVDVHFFQGGMIVEKREGPWIVDLNGGKAIRFPVSASVVAVIDDHLLMKGEKKYYLIDTKKLLQKVSALSGRLPGIFKSDDDFFM